MNMWCDKFRQNKELICKRTFRYSEYSREIKESILKWFGLVERRNNGYIVKKTGEIIVEGNWPNDRPKKKQIGVAGQDIKTCGANKNMVIDREGQKEIIRVGNPTYVGWKRK